MLHRLGKYTFLVISILLLGFALLLSKEWMNDYKVNQEHLLSSITKKVNDEIAVIEKDLPPVKTILNNPSDLSFYKLNIPTEYPFFIFRNGRLMYWSRNRFIPEYQSVKGDYTYKFIYFDNGKFLGRKETLKSGEDRYEVIFLLPIFLKSFVNNKYISSGYNEDIFLSSKSLVKGVGLDFAHKVVSDEGEFLFSIDFSSDTTITNTVFKIIFLCLLILSLIFFFLFIYRLIKTLPENAKYDFGLLILASSFVLVRGLMLYFNFPYSFYKIDLFSSKFYASSVISPSLGDLLLNIIAVCILSGYVFFNYSKFYVYQLLANLRPFAKKIFSVLFVLASFSALNFHVFILNTIFYNSQWTVDITQNIDFSFLKIMNFLIFVLTSFFYFIITHVITRILLKLNPAQPEKIFVLLSVGTAIFFALVFFFGISSYVVVASNFVYLIVVFYYDLSKMIFKFKYANFVYFLLCAAVCSMVAAYAIYSFEILNLRETKQNFANELLEDSDFYGEYLLNDASRKIKEDVFIKNRLLNPFSTEELIEEKISKIYLSNYFDKYDIQIYIFNANGQSFDNPKLNYRSLKRGLIRDKYRTVYNNIIFINEYDNSPTKRYISFIDLKREDKPLGYIILDLKLKRIIPNSIYPELLVDKKFLAPFQLKEYSYGIFSKNELKFSFGDYNYNKDFDTLLFNNSQVAEVGINIKGFHHVVVNGKDQKTVVVSSPVYSVKNAFSNFSFLFQILIALILFVLVLYAVYFQVKNLHLNFATKIQIYLNVAFFLPLVVVSFTILSIVASSYRQEINDSFLKRAENVSNNISANLDDYYKNRINTETLSNALTQLARYSESDINLFNSKGRLIISSQPIIYEKGLLSPYINPIALANITELRNKKILLNESLGSLNYNSAYVAVKSFESSELLGIISIPFFESKYELDRQIINVLTTILNIFTTIFMVLLVLSFLASKVLTVPLNLITQKIKRTSLTGYNEPLDYKSDDEIGLLIGEYNKMLVKLEASKAALSKSEKESAWREMAKQVAHEIKNPLTPMKLTLQHLKRLMKGSGADSGVSEKSINTLLDQVENLNDIATSFSSFASMPIPKNEKFEVSSVLRNVVNLYNTNADIHLCSEIEAGQSFVMGDEQLMNRIFNNLIINGIQSVPSAKKPEIKVRLHKRSSKVFIEIEDNGTGIAENIKEKVFVPNFSTKYAGSGIGLAIAKRGVEHAGGKIWFTTVDGEGTKFSIELPLVI
ncbi:MAG TPA: ATP-binding protein [Cytophagales bacterium]|nr:ATP-binding protein [Cytophagales bacterium]